MQATSGSGTYDFSLLPVDGTEDLVNADPDELSALLSSYRQIAEAAQQSAQFLRDKSTTISWTGRAADSFFSTVHKIPSDLDTVQGDYTTVADALSTYLSVVESVQAPVCSILSQLESLNSQLSTAQGTLSSDRSSLSSLQNAQNNAPANQSHTALLQANQAISSAGTTVSQASSAVSSLQTEISQLQTRGRHLVEEFTGARSHAVATIKGAAHNAPQESFWDSMLGDIEDVIKTGLIDVASLAFGPFLGKYVGEFAWDMVKGIARTVVQAVELPGAIIKFAEDPTWSNLGKVGLDFVAAGTIVLMVTGVGEGMLGAEGAAEGVDGLTEGAESGLSSTVADAFHTVNTYADATKLRYVIQSGSSLSTYGKQADEVADEIGDGHWRAAAEMASVDLTEDAAAHYLDSGTLLPFRKADADANFQGLDVSTGAGEATEQAIASRSFAANVAHGGGQLGSYSELTASEKSSLLQAAGVDDGKLTAASYQTLKNIDSQSLAASSVNRAISTNTAQRVQSFLGDKAIDAGGDMIKGGLGVPVS